MGAHYSELELLNQMRHASHCQLCSLRMYRASKILELEDASQQLAKLEGAKTEQ